MKQILQLQKFFQLLKHNTLTHNFYSTLREINIINTLLYVKKSMEELSLLQNVLQV